jgi:multiple sugar transport system permease protein
VAVAREVRDAGLPHPVTVRRRPLFSRKRMPFLAKRAFLYLVLVPFSLLFIAPFAWMISASFQPFGEIFSWPPHWIPENPTTFNYETFLGLNPAPPRRALAAEGVWRWFVNSAFIATSVTLLQLFFNSLAAYAFAKRRFPGRDVIFLLFLGTMMIPGQVTLVPTYIILRHIPLFGGNDILGSGGHGWLDSYYGLILPGAVSAFGIFLLRQYMQSIPDELIDAARIDGASEFRIFWQVVIPLCRPALAAMAIFTFMYAWEDFFWPLIIVTDPDLFTAPLGLALFVQKHRSAWDLLFAGSVIATLPLIVVFLFFQRQFIRGIALTGIKG